MRRYFITSGTGFIGREIVRQLCKREDTERITLLTRDAQKRYEMLAWDKRISLYEGDITTTDFPHDGDYTDLIHGANEANDLRQPDLHRYYYTIVEGTQRVMDWAGNAFSRILLLSSGAASRDTVYGRAKRMSEFTAEPYLPVVARIYSVIGEEMPIDGQYAAGIFVAQALYDGKVIIHEGSSIRAYLHVEDCAKWLLQLLDDNEAGTYDVCGAPPISIKALAELVAEVFGVPCEHIPDPTYRKDVYVTDNAQPLPNISLRKSIERIRDHYKK